MDSLLHTLRLRTRPIAGVLAVVFLLGSLLAMTPASAKGEMPDHDNAMHMHMHGTMMHHVPNAAPAAPTSHHHGNNACCLGAMNCVQACDHTLIAFNVIADLSGTTGFPFARDHSVAVTRSIQPPRRPPKA